MTETNGKHPTLNLDDFTEPGATIVISDATYHYVRWGALGLLKRSQIQKRYARIDELEKIEEPTEDNAAEYDRTTRELLEMISDVPPAVVASMEPEAQQGAAAYFLAYRSLMTQQRQERMALMLPSLIAAPPTTVPSSPASNGSTTRRARKIGS